MTEGRLNEQAKIESTCESDSFVDDAHLLVMRPKNRASRRVIRTTLNEDVGMKGSKGRFRVSRIDRREIVGDFSVDDDEDLDAFLGFPLEQSIESPFLCVQKC